MECGREGHIGDTPTAMGGEGTEAMTSDETVLVRVMVEADIPAGMRLKHAAGWSQTYADWQRFLALQPRGCFVAVKGSQVVGTVTTCLFDVGGTTRIREDVSRCILPGSSLGPVGWQRTRKRLTAVASLV